jgi:DNA-binding NtrC family response regulator
MLHAEPVTISFPTPEGAPKMAPVQPRTLKEVEKEHILRVLEKHQGNKVAAAAELGIVLKTLYNKLNQWQEEEEALQQERRHAG